MVLITVSVLFLFLSLLEICKTPPQADSLRVRCAAASGAQVSDPLVHKPHKVHQPPTWNVVCFCAASVGVCLWIQRQIS
jgi:hypothetical protein